MSYIRWMVVLWSVVTMPLLMALEVGLVRQCSHFRSAYKGDLLDCYNATIVGVQKYLAVTKLSWTVHEVRVSHSANITDVPSHLFDPIYRELYALDMSHNAIRTLPDGAFYNMNKLLTLRLNNNHINNIRPNLFIDLRALFVLDLSHNMIPSVENSVFVHLENLQDLYLNNNRIMKLGAEAFRHVYNLRTLNLSHNRLVVFPFVALEKTLRLEKLALAFNKLKEVTFEPFDNSTEYFPLSSIVSLEFNNNSLKSFDLRDLEYLPSLQIINLEKNMFNCSMLPDMIEYYNNRVKWWSFEVKIELDNTSCYNYNSLRTDEQPDTSIMHSIFKYLLYVSLGLLPVIYIGYIIYRNLCNRKRSNKRNDTYVRYSGSNCRCDNT